MSALLLFLAGAVTGSAAMFAALNAVRRAELRERDRSADEIERLRCANRRLREDLTNSERCSDSRDAYHRGLEAGRSNPYTEADKIVRAFNGRNVKVGGNQEAR